MYCLFLYVLWLVCSKMSVSLDCPFLLIPSVFFSTDFTKCEQLDRNNCNASILDWSQWLKLLISFHPYLVSPYKTLCDNICTFLVTGRMFSPNTSVSSTNKTDIPRNNINIINNSVGGTRTLMQNVLEICPQYKT